MKLGGKEALGGVEVGQEYDHNILHQNKQTNNNKNPKPKRPALDMFKLYQLGLLNPIIMNQCISEHYIKRKQN